jgi:hypothetical protein
MKDYKILYFGLGIAAVLLYLKYMKDKPLKKEDIANKNVTPTTPMTSTTSTGGIVATTTEKIKEAFGQGAMTLKDIAGNKGNSGGGGVSRKPQDVPLREYKGADGSSSAPKKSFTSIDQACKCADNTTTNQLGILKNFGR